VSISLVVLLIVLMILTVSSIRIVKDYQRTAVFRPGRFFGVRGPGLICIVPMVDKVEIIDLNRWVPEWQRMPKEEIDEEGEVRCALGLLTAMRGR
jgi:regulator of protease activity HflC (stomatin/prohibitin superfamily)